MKKTFKEELTDRGTELGNRISDDHAEEFKAVATAARERMAALEHEQWALWTRYMLDNMTAENVIRWRRQIDTPYDDLTEKEKDSDREWADRALATASEALTEPLKQTLVADITREFGQALASGFAAPAKPPEGMRYKRRRPAPPVCDRHAALMEERRKDSERLVEELNQCLDCAAAPGEVH